MLMASNKMQLSVQASAMMSMRYIYVRFKALIGKLWAENLLEMTKRPVWCQSKD